MGLLLVIRLFHWGMLWTELSLPNSLFETNSWIRKFIASSGNLIKTKPLNVGKVMMWIKVETLWIPASFVFMFPFCLHDVVIGSPWKLRAGISSYHGPAFSVLCSSWCCWWSEFKRILVRSSLFYRWENWGWEKPVLEIRSSRSSFRRVWPLNQQHLQPGENLLEMQTLRLHSTYRLRICIWTRFPRDLCAL